MTNSRACCPSGNAKASVRELYTALALRPHSDFGWGKGKANALRLGYERDYLDTLPECVWESSAATGNPFELGPLHAGEVVVDVGCGAGADLCIAALKVGRTGKAIGIDMTPAMVAKARENARTVGLENVLVHEADMVSLPIGDACADVVISNGSINLAADKEQVFAEIHRVLRPGGRLQFVDVARRSCSNEPDATTNGSWADCVAGTLPPSEYVALLTAAGLSKVEHLGWTGYRTSADTEGAVFRAIKT